MPKTHYQTSGKINRNALIIATILALPASIGCGMFYGRSVENGLNLIPRIFALSFWSMLLFLVFYLFRRFNKSRNAKLNLQIGIVFSLASWLTSWVFFWELDMNWIHLLDLVFVALPLSTLLVMNYYCEKCSRYYSKTATYILDADRFYKMVNQSSNYDFLMEMNLEHLPNDGPADPKEIIKIEFFYCKSCGSNPIVNIDSYTWTQVSEHSNIRMETFSTHISHGDSETSFKKSIASGVYLDAATGDKMKQYLIG